MDPIQCRASGRATEGQMMDGRRAVMVALALTVLLGPFAVKAQQSERVYRVGLFDHSAPEGRQILWDAFRQQMRRLGYVEGQNVRFEPRWGQGDHDRLRSGNWASSTGTGLAWPSPASG